MTGDAQTGLGAVRVLVVDDQRLMRDGLTSLLSLQPGIAIVGAATNGQEAVEQAVALRPDVILMDIRMPVLDGVVATTVVRRELPRCKVLMLTTFDDDDYIVGALRAGASGYLLKDMPASDLAQAIQAVHKGLYQLDPAVASKVIAALTTPQTVTPPPQNNYADGTTDAHNELSERERDVLRLIAQGATNREIASTLMISEGTVKNHISHILSRLNLRDRTQAAIYAREAGLL